MQPLRFPNLNPKLAPPKLNLRMQTLQVSTSPYVSGLLQTFKIGVTQNNSSTIHFSYLSPFSPPGQAFKATRSFVNLTIVLTIILARECLDMKIPVLSQPPYYPRITEFPWLLPKCPPISYPIFSWPISQFNERVFTEENSFDLFSGK